MASSLIVFALHLRVFMYLICQRRYIVYVGMPREARAALLLRADAAASVETTSNEILASVEDYDRAISRSLYVSPNHELKPATVGTPITVTVSRSDTSKSDIASPVTLVPATFLATTPDVGYRRLRFY
ncbi:hypothetical protein Tco_0236771 [Tanacetum coccineum]